MALPRLLDELEVHGLTATFFLEAINCEMYPGAVREIAARGHEVGHHGWQHEPWAALDPRDEHDALQRGRHAFEELGVPVRGFRPPGGELTPSSPELLAEVGVEWCSPATVPKAETAGGVRVPFDWNELRYLPFDWRAVDAYHLMPRFEDLRRERGDQPQTRSPPEALELLCARVDAAATDGAPEVLVLHPFLMLDPEWWECVPELLAKIAARALSGDLVVGPGNEFAQPLRAPLSRF